MREIRGELSFDHFSPSKTEKSDLHPFGIVPLCMTDLFSRFSTRDLVKKREKIMTNSNLG